MNLFVGAFFNAAILGLAAVIFGALFGKLHPLIDIFAHFLLAAILSQKVFTVSGSDHRAVLAEIAFKE